MSNMSPKKHQSAFALLDVLLAIIVLAVTMIGIYNLTGGAADASRIRGIQSDLSNIGQAYSVFLNSDGIDESDNSVLENNKLSKAFLIDAAIPQNHFSDKNTGSAYTFLNSGLAGVSSTDIAFLDGVIQIDKNSSQKILVAGFEASCKDVATIIQTMKNNFGVFITTKGNALTSATLARTLPDCSKNTSFSVYLTIPMVGSSQNISPSFSVPISG